MRCGVDGREVEPAMHLFHDRSRSTRSGPRCAGAVHGHLGQQPRAPGLTCESHEMLEKSCCIAPVSMIAMNDELAAQDVAVVDEVHRRRAITHRDTVDRGQVGPVLLIGPRQGEDPPVKGATRGRVVRQLLRQGKLQLKPCVDRGFIVGGDAADLRHGGTCSGH